MRELTKGIIYLSIVAVINAILISWGFAVTAFDLSRHGAVEWVPFGYIILTTINEQTVQNPFTFDIYQVNLVISGILDVGCLIGYLWTHRTLLRVRSS